MPVDGKFYGMFDSIIHQVNPFFFLFNGVIYNFELIFAGILHAG